MTAKEAHQRSLESATSKINTDLDRINLKIDTAIGKGNFSATVSFLPVTEVKTTLTELGYTWSEDIPSGSFTVNW